MRFRDLFLDTLRTLWAHKLRTFLTMFGIAWGIVSIVLMVGAGEGLRAGQAKVAEQFGKNIMIVFAGRTSTEAGGLRAGRRIEFRDQDIPVIVEQAPDCEWVLPELGQGDIRVRSEHNNAALLVTASWPPFADVRSLDVAEGRFYNWADVQATRRVAFIGSETKKQLFGSRQAVGQTIHLNDIPYLVIGTMRPKDQDSSYDGQDVSKVFVPYSVMKQDFPNKPPSTPDSLDRMLVVPRSLAVHESCKQQLRAALGKIHHFDPTDKEAANIWDTIENAKAFAAMTDGMKYFLGAVGFVTLMLGGLGVMNVMLVAVRERTREIGVRKAVGARSSAILRQFFVESVLVAGLSGVVGFTVAFGFCALVNSLPMPPFFAGLLPTWKSALLAFLLLSTVAIGSSLYPARRAAAVDPIEALRFEAGG